MTASTAPERRRLMSTDELAALLAVEPRTIVRWRRAGTGPPFLSFGRTIRYHPTRVSHWLAAREQQGGTPSDDEGGTPLEGATPTASEGATRPSRGAPRGR